MLGVESFSAPKAAFASGLDSTLPILLLHGAQDTWNPCATSQRFAAALAPSYASHPQRLCLSIIPHAPHWPPAAIMIEEAVSWLHHYVANPQQQKSLAHQL